MIPKDLGKHL